MAGNMNEFEWLQWFLVENFSGQLRTASDGILALAGTQKLTLERIAQMEKNIQDKIDAIQAGFVADAEAKTKVLGEIKSLLEASNVDLEAAIAAAKEAQKAEDKAAFDAANAEVISALEAVEAAQKAGLELTKTLDDQVEDVPAPPVEPPVEG